MMEDVKFKYKGIKYTMEPFTVYDLLEIISPVPRFLIFGRRMPNKKEVARRTAMELRKKITPKVSALMLCNPDFLDAVNGAIIKADSLNIEPSAPKKKTKKRKAK